MQPKIAHTNSDVKILGTNLRGTIISHNLKTEICEVDVQGKIVKISLEKLKLIENKTKKSEKIAGKQSSKKVSSLSLDLHGFTKEQAHEALISLIDKALKENASSLEIIHGHGSGVIKTFVHKFLEKSKFVANFKLAAFNTGTTIAFLK